MIICRVFAPVVDAKKTMISGLRLGASDEEVSKNNNKQGEQPQNLVRC